MKKNDCAPSIGTVFCFLPRSTRVQVGCLQSKFNCLGGFKCLLPRRQSTEWRRMVLEFWWFLRELCRVAKVDRGKEHSLLMHQCTTQVLCNLAGLIFGLAFSPFLVSLKNQYD